MKLFVVLGESGDYSDRNVWVSGVYSSATEAQGAIDAAAKRRGEWDNWHIAYLRELRKENAAGRYGSFTDEQQAKAKAAVYAAPPYERTERAEIEETEIGVWK